MFHARTTQSQFEHILYNITLSTRAEVNPWENITYLFYLIYFHGELLSESIRRGISFLPPSTPPSVLICIETLSMAMAVNEWRSVVSLPPFPRNWRGEE